MKEKIGSIENIWWDGAGRFAVHSDGSISGEDGSFWPNPYAWASDFWNVRGWVVKPIVADRALLKVAEAIERQRIGSREE